MSMTRAVWSGVLGVCLLAASTTVWSRQDHGAGAAFDAETVGRIDAVFAPWDTTASPGCALGCEPETAAVRYARGYGMANLEYDAAISPDSIFHVASISKQFAAFSVALLAADGKLSLDDDVRKHLPELPDFGKRITVRHLMHHTSGLRDQWTLQTYAGWREDDVITEADVLHDGRQTARPQLRPGRGIPLQQHRLHAARPRSCTRDLRPVAARVRRGAHLRAARHDAHALPRRPHDDRAGGRTSAYQPRPDGGFRISIPGLRHRRRDQPVHDGRRPAALGTELRRRARVGGRDAGRRGPGRRAA